MTLLLLLSPLGCTGDQPPQATDSSVDSGDTSDSTGFELAYSYAVNDNVTITPGFFSVGETTSDNEDSGVVLETAFSF